MTEMQQLAAIWFAVGYVWAMGLRGLVFGLSPRRLSSWVPWRRGE